MEWLKTRLSVCVDDIRVWTAGTFVNRSVAEVIRRLVRVRNLIASNHMRYVCGGLCDPTDPTSGCGPTTWAFVCLPIPCPPGSIPSIIHLCRAFWEPGIQPDNTRVSRADQAEFQAQTIIHEAAHLYYCIDNDSVGRTIGVTECVAQFVAATNGGPIDCNFGRRCMRTTVCGAVPGGAPDPCPPAAATAPAGGAAVGFAGAPMFKVVRTVFQPRNAIRLRGRPAVRRTAARR